MTRPASISASVFGHALLLLCTLGVIWGVIAIHVRQEYDRALQDGETRTVNLARAFEETVSRSIAALDQALYHVRDLYLLDPGHLFLDNWLHGKTVLREISVQIAVIDATGHMLTTTAAGSAANVDLSDREHFRVHIESTMDRLFISKPVIGRASGQLSIQFTRRVTDRNNGFAGVVVASLDPRSLGVFRESSDVGEGFAMLVGRDGVVRAAQPDASRIGASVLPPANAEMARMFDGDAPASGAAAGTETSVGPDGIVSYLAVTGYPLFVTVGISRHAAFASYEDARRDSLLAGASLSLIVLFVAFITFQQRYRLARFHQALTITLDNISQGIVMIDKRRKLRVINRQAVKLVGLPPELARPGADFDEILRWQVRHGDIQTARTGDDRIDAMIRRGGIDPSLACYERSRADGTVLEVRTSVLPDGGAVRTVTDITERKKNESDLARARDAAEAGVRARTEFLAVISHEIRTPMNGIIGAAGLLRDMRLDTEQREYVRIIRESSDHLSSLMQNILDFSRLDTGRLDLEEVAFSPGALIQGTIAILGGQARDKGLKLEARTRGDVPDRVSGDPSRLRQILVNLIDNAIKFTNSGEVTVETRVTATDARSVTLSIAVTDTGIGIDPLDQQKLFSAFTQVDGSISRRFGGTGLGLAICARLVNLMGGAIMVDSVLGQGSTFRFSIEMRRAAAEKRPDTTARDAGTSGRYLKVLLAEDNPTNRHVAMRMLTRMGHTVDAVEDGGRAFVAATAADYDVILMDMMMPDVDGLTATRMIRASPPPRCNTMIVGLTANALDSDRAACADAGMNGFVTKPVTSERLRDALEQTTRQARQPPEPSLAQLVDTEFLGRLANDIGLAGTVEVVRVFLEDAPGHIAAIKNAMAREAVQVIRQEAHALAGASRSVGLMRLGEAASSLQKLSTQALPDEAAIESVVAAFRDAGPLAIAWADAHGNLAASVA